MPLKYICPRCSKLHRNIDKRLLGEKVQCSCGKVIRLGGRIMSGETRTKKTAEPSPAPGALHGENQTGATPVGPSADQAERTAGLATGAESVQPATPDPAQIPVRDRDQLVAAEGASGAMPVKNEEIPDSGLFEIIDDDSFEVLDDDSFDVADEPPADDIEPSNPESTPPTANPRGIASPPVKALAGRPSESFHAATEASSPAPSETADHQHESAKPIDPRFVSFGPPPAPLYPAEPAVADGPPSSDGRLANHSRESGVSLTLLLTCVACLIFGAWIVYHDTSTGWFAWRSPVRAVALSIYGVLLALRIMAALLLVSAAVLVLVDLFKSAQFGTRVFPAAHVVFGIAAGLLVVVQFFVFLLFLVVGLRTIPVLVGDETSLVYNFAGSFFMVLLPMWVLLHKLVSRP